MPDILIDLPIRAPLRNVMRAVSTSAGLDRWWTNRSEGTPKRGATFRLQFAPEYDWRAAVVSFDGRRTFELEVTEADADWVGTRIGFRLSAARDTTILRFRHVGWPARNEHFRVSCYCWAMYLRALKRYLEIGEIVPYASRLDV